VPLHADAEPVRIGRFIRFDHTVQRQRTDLELGRDLFDGLVMIAVDADFPAALDLIEQGVGQKVDRMAMRPTGQILVRQRLWHIFRQV